MNWRDPEAPFWHPKVQKVGIHALAFEMSGMEQGRLSQLTLCSD